MIEVGGIAVVAKVAEMATKLRRLTGPSSAAAAAYAKAPPDAIHRITVRPMGGMPLNFDGARQRTAVGVGEWRSCPRRSRAF
jgi:hypothetical protein